MEEKLSADRLAGSLVGAEDIITRRIALGPAGDRHAVLFYAIGLTDKNFINAHISSTLLHHGAAIAAQPSPEAAAPLFPGMNVRPVHHLPEAREGILTGDTLILIPGMEGGLLVESKGFVTRQPQEPEAEGVVRGPHEGLTESLEGNLSLIRRRLPDQALQVRFCTAGTRSKTKLALLWIQDVASPQTVQHMQTRLKELKLDAVLDSGTLEHYLMDQWWTPFPLIQNSGRPDRLAAALLEGRVVLLADTANTGLVMPTVFSALFTVTEDYYYNAYVGTFLRWIRFLALWMSLYLPSLYVALVGVHPEMIPLSLMLASTAARENVPLPIFLEAVFMEITLELLREAGLRLPKPIGQTIGIVGGIIIGDAAVNAGLVSPAMVLVVSLTAVASFTIPDYQVGWTIRIIRFPLIIMTALFGLFGLIVGSVLLLYHLVGLTSAGVPYLAPYSPIHLQDLKDGWLLRSPLRWLKRPPGFYRPPTSSSRRRDKGGAR